MAANVGNLAIVISGNARPFQQTLSNVRVQINQFGRDTAGQAGSGLQSAGTSLRGMLVAGFGGGLAGAVAATAMTAFGGIIHAIAGTVGQVGHHAATFLTEAFQEGLKISRLELGVNFLANGPEVGGEWLKSIRELSQQSGFDMAGLGQSLSKLAGSTDELDNVLPTLRAITTISAGIGADAAQLSHFALAVSQVVAAGRFESQELNQLTEAGLPIKELAKTAGMSVGQFRQAVKDSTVSVDVLAQTFNRMIGPGGRFFGMLEERARSGVGQVDKLSSTWLMFKQDLGKGLLEGAVDSGFLTAIQNGVNELAKNLPAIKGFIGDAFGFMRDLAIAGAHFAGIAYDTGTFLKIMAQQLYQSLRFMGALVSITNPLLASFVKFHLDVAKVFLDNPLPLLQDWGTGDRWAADIANAFKQNMAPAVQSVFSNITITPKLSPELQKMLDEATKAVKEGGPFTQFERGLRQIDAIKEFKAPTFSQRVWGQLMGIGDVANRGVQPAIENQLIAKQFMELEKGLKQAIDHFPAAMAKGSQEAASVIAHAAFSSDQRTMQERVLDVANAAKKAQEETAKNTAALVAEIKKLQGNGVFK